MLRTTTNERGMSCGFLVVGCGLAALATRNLELATHTPFFCSYPRNKL